MTTEQRRAAARGRAADGAARSSAPTTRPILKATDLEGARRPGLPVLVGAAVVSASLAALGRRTGRPALRRVGRWRRPARACRSWRWCTTRPPGGFLNMLRVFKPTSRCQWGPGCWTRSALAAAAAASELTGVAPALAGRRAGSGLLGPALATYTSGAAGRHRRPGLARGLPGAAVRVRRQRPGQWRRAGPARRAGAPVRRPGSAIAGAALESTASTVLEAAVGFAARAYTDVGRARCCAPPGHDGRRSPRRAGRRTGRRPARATPLCGRGLLLNAAASATRYGVF